MIKGPWMAFVAIFALFAAILALLLFPTGFFLWTTAAVAIGTGLALMVCLRLAPEALLQRMGSLRAKPTERLYLAILIFLLLTMLPLPLRLSRITGAERYAQNRRAAEAVETACELQLLPSAPLFFAHTRNKAGTLRIAFMVIAMFGAAMLAALLPRNSKISYVRFATICGSAVAAAGLISRFRYPQGDTLWWIYPIPHGLPGPVAGFTSPNHFGAFLAMLCPAQLGVMSDDFSKGRPVRGIFGAACFAVMSLGILFSYSRGSFIAYLAGTMISTVLLAHRRKIAATLGLGLFATVVAVSLLVFAGPEVKERLETLRHVTETDSYATRTSAWRDSLSIFCRYPVAGAGANAFRMVYPQFRGTSDGAVMTHAENEYVQLLTDGGIAGVFVFIALLYVLRRDAVKPALAGGSGTAVLVSGLAPLLTAAVHCLIDFPMHIPVYAVTLASLAGMLLPFPSPGRTALRLGPRIRLGLPGAPALSMGAAVLLTLLWGRFARMDSASVMSRLPIAGVKRALVWAPTSAEAWQQFGRAAVQARRTPETERFRESCVTRAVAYDPNNYRIWNTLGHLRNALGDRQGAAGAFARVKELRHWYDVPFLPEDLK